MEDDVSALRTERLLLRCTLDGDLAAYREVHGDPATSTCRRAGAATPQECADRVSESGHRWDDVGLDYWTVVERLTGDILGFGGLRPDNGELNMYFRFRPSAWGYGYAYEMARAALGWSARHRPDEPVVIWTQPANSAALRLSERVGFVRDGSRETDGYVEWSFRAPEARPAGEAKDAGAAVLDARTGIDA